MGMGSFGGGENVLELGSGDVCITLLIYFFKIIMCQALG